MKTSCERCARPFTDDAGARVCSYECTFCASCAQEMGDRCPNCGGLLAPRQGSAQPW